MIEKDDAVIIDECLALLPGLLLNSGITLKQKCGYKAGKLSRTRNWCQLVDGDVQLQICFPNSQGQVKTWKLFARFDSRQPPLWLWDKPERYERKKEQWTISGGDVWGVAYEDIRACSKGMTSSQLLERLAGDLQVSFDYSRHRYC